LALFMHGKEADWSTRDERVFWYVFTAIGRLIA
jgi:hypothetical protein